MLRLGSKVMGVPVMGQLFSAVPGGALDVARDDIDAYAVALDDGAAPARRSW